MARTFQLETCGGHRIVARFAAAPGAWLDREAEIGKDIRIEVATRDNESGSHWSPLSARHVNPASLAALLCEALGGPQAVDLPPEAP